ncbi:MAG: glucosidase [Cytophagales bacterium]|nr:glucosidase [Cytophagales bacterium]
MKTAEEKRLDENYQNKKPWLKWGPYLSERQWGTVREDYSPDGEAWDYLPHDHARSRTYRWGEDGIAGISDDQQRLCFSTAVWNGADPIIKERIFGLAGAEGNHGEDGKELYYYVDCTPSHSYMKHIYKYPQQEFPYRELIDENGRRGLNDPEFELLDTGVFNENKYFDVQTEYAKGSAEDILVRITAFNRSENEAPLSIVPQLWFRNLWDFGLIDIKPEISLAEQSRNWSRLALVHETLGTYHFYFQTPSRLMFTENETNRERVFGEKNKSPYVKDAFHDALLNDDYSVVESRSSGTKFAPLYQYVIKGKGKAVVHMRLVKEKITGTPFGKKYEEIFKERISEADSFYKKVCTDVRDAELQLIQRQAFAGMLWSKQYYNIDIERWLDGDKGQPKPPKERLTGRNFHWRTLNNQDIISMPDKWEYPWYAAWDLAFHCITLAQLDVQFAKDQMILIMREWYMHPNGQIPAYEWNFGDVNPPVHAWATYKVYELEKKETGKGDVNFLKRVFQKLMLNFTWWVNRKDSHGKNVFEGGFLGLDNIGVFDRSKNLPEGGQLEQADGTSWMAMFSLYMLKISIEICKYDSSFEDVTTKFFEHFVYIAESLNKGDEEWIGAWNEEDGMYYDILQLPNDEYIPIKVRSLVSLSPLFAVTLVRHKELSHIPDFLHRLQWFYNYRRELGKYQVIENMEEKKGILFSMVNHQRLKRLVKNLLNESEFLGKGGIRALSKVHEEPYHIEIQGQNYDIRYAPAESDTYLFGGNSNWRGPIWLPMNYLLIHALRDYFDFFGPSFKVEFPTGSGVQKDLCYIADEISKRLIWAFRKDENGDRPINDKHPLYRDPHFENLLIFPEYFHGDTSRGVGASHQTGWTGLVATLIEEVYGRKK